MNWTLFSIAVLLWVIFTGGIVLFGKTGKKRWVALSLFAGFAALFAHDALMSRSW